MTDTEIKNLIESGIAIFHQALPPSVLIHCDSNNPVSAWVAKANEVLKRLNAESAQTGTCASAVDCGMPCCVHTGRCQKSLENELAKLKLEGYAPDLTSVLCEINATGEYDFKNGSKISFKQCAWAVPDGWKLVPTEPTEEMINLGHTALDYFSARAHPMNNFTMRAKYCYKQMLSAAPTPNKE